MSENKSSLPYFWFIIPVILIISSILSLKLFHPNSDLSERQPQYGATSTYDLSNMWGKPAPGLYPEITNPKYMSPDQTSKFMADNDNIILLKEKAGYLAFPNFILGFHHVVNDTIDDNPVAVTYCCQTDAAFVYSRLVDGKTYTFAALGPMYFGNKVLFDKETNSYWIELTGEAFYGSLKGKRLNVLMPLSRTTWGKIKALPNLKVLAPQKEISFYRTWFARMQDEKAGLYALERKKQPDPRMSPFTRGIGIIISGQAKFYPLDEIKTDDLINDNLGGWNIILWRDRDLDSVRIFRRFIGNRILTFTSDNQIIQDKETRSTWDSDGLSKAGKLKGARLDTPIYTQVFWYAWSAFYPNTTIYKQ